MLISKRLQTIASLIPAGASVADVGCDHAWLPIWLYEQGAIKNAVAMDINSGPLERAKEHIREHGLESVIKTRISDGLAGLLPGECNALVIAGMGGPLMERILEEGSHLLPGFEQMILQPQSDIPHFRQWLYDHGFFISDEKMVKEDGKFYPVIKASHAPEKWMNRPGKIQMYCGPVLLAKRDPVLKKYLEFRLRICKEILENLQKADSPSAGSRTEEILEEINIIQAALSVFQKKDCREEKMENYTVQVGDRTLEYEEGTKLQKIADDLQDQYPHEIILARMDGKLCELTRKLNRKCRLEFVTTAESVGHQAYIRTVVFVFLKAIYDTVGKKNAENAVIHYSVDNSIYFTMVGMNELSAEFLDRVKAEMHRIVEENIPIQKRSVPTDEAVRLFHRHHMYDKEKLFRFRRSSWVNIYSIQNFDDYFYGYMASTTGTAAYFDLKPYDEGCLLILPRAAQPTMITEPVLHHKIFNVQKKSAVWVDKLDVSTVGDLNERIAQGDFRNLILIQEALHEAEITKIAAEIASRKGVRFVMIAGPSSSGKTSFSHRLSIQLAAYGLRPHAIEVDNYFKNREDTPLDENGERDYECLEAIDTEGFNRDMNDLLAGKCVMLPTFNFITGKREYNGERLTLGKNDILVIEGIHGLNDGLSYALPEESKFRIYISALTQLNIDEHNRIPTTDGRLIRRIVRDARKRGIQAEETIKRWPSVRRGEEKFIFSNQERADVMFNSALVYELASLKIYAEPLLFGIPQDSPVYEEAKRLLKFLEYFLPIPGDDVPNNSLLREFIGGSIFNV